MGSGRIPSKRLSPRRTADSVTGNEPAIMTAQGVVDLPSKYSVAETIDRLESSLRAKGIAIFLRLDQAAEAAKAGLTLRGTQLLVFGDPRAGTPLMAKNPSLALDLPLKALAWEAADGKVWLSYNSPEYLMARHQLAAPPFRALAAILLSATS
jgi:uncharacterized protein (DUF302 family)